MPNATSLRLYGAELSRFKHINYPRVRGEKNALSRQIAMAYESPPKRLAIGIRTFGVNPDTFSITPAAFERLIRTTEIDIGMAKHSVRGGTIDVALNNVLGRLGLITFFDGEVNRFWVMRAKDVRSLSEDKDKIWVSDEIYHMSTGELDTALAHEKARADRIEDRGSMDIQNIKDTISTLFVSADDEFQNQLIWIVTRRLMDENTFSDHPKIIFGSFWEATDPDKKKGRAFVDELGSRLANASKQAAKFYEVLALFSDLPSELSKLLPTAQHI